MIYNSLVIEWLDDKEQNNSFWGPAWDQNGWLRQTATLTAWPPGLKLVDKEAAR